MENQVFGKRALDGDNDDQVIHNGQKKFKSANRDELLSFENIRNENENSNRWKLLPSVVYELLALFKKSEEQNQENNPHTKKELKIEPNTNCQEKLNISVNVNVNENPDIDKKCSLKHDENTSHNTESLKLLEVDKSTMLKSTVKNSTQSLDKQDLCTIKKEKVEVEKKIITSTTLNGNIKDNDIQKVNKEKDNKKRSDSKNQHTLNKSVSNKSKPTKISPIPTNTIKISKEKTKNYISNTETMFILDKKVQLHNFLKNLYLDEISLPTNKPPLCICQYCIFVDSLTIEQSLAYLQFNYENNLHYKHQNLHCDMYSSNITVSDCSNCASRGIYTTNNCFCIKSDIMSNLKHDNIETPKNVWVNRLISSMQVNEKISKNKVNDKLTSFNSAVMNKVFKAADKIKKRLTSLCDACKKSKKSVCKCNAQHVKEKNYNEKLPIEKHSSRGSRKHRRH